MKGWKICLGIGIAVLILGIIIFLTGLGLNGWNLRVEYEMKTFHSEEDNDKLDLSMSVGEMNVLYYDGENIEVTYPDSYQYGYTVYEKNGKLSVESKSHLFFWFGWNNIPAVTVKIPQGKVMDLDLSVSAGKATVASGEFGKVSLEMSAGMINVGDITCGNFKCSLSAGTAYISGVNCTKADIRLSAGSATVKNVQCDKIDVDLSAGSCTLSVLGQRSDYNITVDKSAGSCNVGNQTGAVAGKIIDIDLSAGSVNVTFTD